MAYDLPLPLFFTSPKNFIIFPPIHQKPVAPNLVDPLPLKPETTEWIWGRVTSMSVDRQIVDEVDPVEACKLLEADPDAVLIDVRTQAEWAFVGQPDLSVSGRPVWPIEWVAYPDMARNLEFASELAAQSDGKLPTRLFFICRSGARSMAAARSVAAGLAEQGVAAHCTNIAEGFEGDLDHEGHRGQVNGWKKRGLPWRQN